MERDDTEAMLAEIEGALNGPLIKFGLVFSEGYVRALLRLARRGLDPEVSPSTVGAAWAAYQVRLGNLTQAEENRVERAFSAGWVTARSAARGDGVSR